MRVAAYIACVILIVAAGGFSFLALLATGGDSAFAGKSHWIYAPWLVALFLTLSVIVATATVHVTWALGLTATAACAYTATWFIWGLFKTP